MTCSRQQGQSLPFPHRHPRDDVTKRPCRSASGTPPKQAWKDSLGMSEPRSVAHLAERLYHTQEVVSSTLTVPTTKPKWFHNPNM